MKISHDDLYHFAVEFLIVCFMHMFIGANCSRT